MEKIERGEYVSRKEYLKKYNSNVGYALYIQNNIKRNDYARLNTGKIVKVIGIKENKVNKKAIYYGVYDSDWFDSDWFDSSAVENFSKNIIDLIEVGDYVNGYKVSDKEGTLLITNVKGIDRSGYHIPISQYGEGIKSIVTKEQMASIEYRVEEDK